MERSNTTNSWSIPAAVSAERATEFLRRVYGWMCFGLGITALVAYTLLSVPGLAASLVANHLVFLGLFAVQIGLVFYLSARVDRLAAGSAAAPRDR